MTINLNIPDDRKDEIVDAMCYLGGYEPTVRNYFTDESGDPILDENGKPTFEDVPNPITKNVFSKEQLITILKNSVKKHKYLLREKQFNSDNSSDRGLVDTIDIT